MLHLCYNRNHLAKSLVVTPDPTGLQVIFSNENANVVKFLAILVSSLSANLFNFFVLPFLGEPVAEKPKKEQKGEAEKYLIADAKLLFQYGDFPNLDKAIEALIDNETENREIDPQSLVAQGLYANVEEAKLALQKLKITR